VAALYERSRPEYPDDAVRWLVDRLGLGPGRVALDLAAGTGKLTRRLVPTGARVLAVEPLAEMREQLREAVPAAEVVTGTAEQLPLETASADAVTVGQAFHWFDAERATAEIARVLAPGGALALVWNMRELSDPLQEHLNALLLPYRRDTPSEHEQPWRAVLRVAPTFGPEVLRSFPWVQPHTTEQLVDRISSVSFVARLEAPERDRLLERVREAVAGLSQPFAFTYRTDVFVFPRLS
jgi:SAM-dependent methyltransferase